MYRSRVRSGLSLPSGVASKARRRRRKSSAFALAVPGMPTIVACLRDFGDRRADPFLMCLDIFRLRGKGVYTSVQDGIRRRNRFGRHAPCLVGRPTTGLAKNAAAPNLRRLLEGRTDA